jgi:hypothetical protein
MTRARRFWLEWAGVYLVCLLLCSYFQFQTPFIPEEDGYFHIKFAEMLRHHGFFRGGFPWSYFSLWREGFSDGAVFFHLLLIPFTFLDLEKGAKLAACALSAFTLSSFYAILTLNQVRARLYWFWLFLLGGGFFWWRMLMPRPQILSVGLMLWSLHFLLNGRRKAFAALSFLYPLSYVAAFLPQAFAVMRWAYLKAVDRRSEGRIALWGLGAYGLATLVHPYFPKNLTFFYVQNFYVMFLELTQKVNLFLANEMLPVTTREFFVAHLPLIAHLFVVSFVFMHRRPALSERTRVLFPIAFVLVALTCGSKRFVEYSVPVATLFCAFFFMDVFAGYDEDRLARDYGRLGQAALTAWLIGMGAATGVEAGIVRRDMRNVPAPRFKELAAALSRKAPPGDLVFACDWDEPPELLFYADQYRYPVMMDPTFMYYWSPETWKTWNAVSNGRLSPDETRDALLGTFHARYGVCGSKFWSLRQLIGADKRFEIVSENPYGYVFEVR